MIDKHKVLRGVRRKQSSGIGYSIVSLIHEATTQQCLSHTCTCTKDKMHGVGNDLKKVLEDLTAMRPEEGGRYL